MLLKQHESSRLLQHKAAIDQYTEQLRCYSLELAGDNITADTKTEIEKLIKTISAKLNSEIKSIKDFTYQLQKEYGSSSFDDFMNIILNAISEAEKIFSVLPDDLKKPLIAIAEKIKSVLNYIKSIF